MKPIFCLFVTVLLFGCASLVPGERKASEAVKSSEAIATAQNQTIRRTLEVVPEIALRVSQSSNISGVALPTVREQVEIFSSLNSDAGSKEFARGSNQVVIPFGVKSALVGVGLVIMVAGVTWAWHVAKTTSFGQGIKLADNVLAGQIRSWRNHLAQTTDDREKLEANAEIAELEAERGRLLAKASV